MKQLKAVFLKPFYQLPTKRTGGSQTLPKSLRFHLNDFEIAITAIQQKQNVKEAINAFQRLKSCH